MKVESKLYRLPGVIAATALIRSASGELDCEKIQELFGLDQAPSDQEVGSLAKITALLVLNPDPENFRKWLRTPNPEIDSITPIELITTGRAEIVANLVEDILTNRGG